MPAKPEDALKYEKVLKTLRARIRDGVYPPGTMLPSQHQLVAEFDVSRPTVIEALRLLRQEGLIETQTGRGSFVRGKTPSLGIEADPHPGRRLLDVAEADSRAELLQAGIVVAPARVAALLELPTGTKAFVRRYVVGDEDGPIELVSAWFPLDLVAGTKLASPEPLDEGIRRHLYGRKRLRLDYAIERTLARGATAEEASVLQVDPGAPVLNLLVSGIDPEGRPRQLVDAVLPGDRHELRDVYPLA
ncbi:GntR family transcriptional regulator [Bailinhaonella thermotolerans]|uniref:GntR family transcriptional regulator n=1 Tax=Bailinhaonella thermotolerans TaxID=1070861 RepID=A0A3A4A2Q2_9ACTN|nr:GntR family transcriptional regulator [Bailinhaonella thermotolerans]RJL22705.1 GntR family transcriptional regulator [Bailinhaonella thermotolerans]